MSSESDSDQENKELTSKHIVRCVLFFPDGGLLVKVPGGTWHLEATAALLSSLPPLNTPERDMFGRTLARRCESRRVFSGDITRNLARLGIVARFSSFAEGLDDGNGDCDPDDNGADDHA